MRRPSAFALSSRLHVAAAQTICGAGPRRGRHISEKAPRGVPAGAVPTRSVGCAGRIRHDSNATYAKAHGPSDAKTHVELVRDIDPQSGIGPKNAAYAKDGL